MNYPRIVLAALGGFVTYFALGGIFFGALAILALAVLYARAHGEGSTIMSTSTSGCGDAAAGRGVLSSNGWRWGSSSASSIGVEAGDVLPDSLRSS